MILSMVQGAKEDNKHKTAGQAPASSGGGASQMESILKGIGGSPTPAAAPSNLAAGEPADPWDSDAFGDAGY